MAVDGSKQSRVSATPLPPRTLNVQKFAEARASELETLHSILANRLDNDFRSRRNKRRRTTGYDNRGTKNRSRKRQKSGVVDLGGAVASEKHEGRVPPRRIRRRIELRKNLESGFSTSGDGTKRLRTHVWHAKRFKMTKLWGFHLPLGLQGRGKGSRALLKRFRDGAVIHDASYYGAVQLEGPQNSLLEMLSTILVPFQSSRLEDISHSLLSGATYGNAMLHHVEAPMSPAVAPVTYMWQPLQQQSAPHEEYHNADQYKEPQGAGGGGFFRKLWVWIHASAFDEGYDVLKLACQKQMDEAGIFLNCISLQGKLAKLEVMGSKAFQLLQKILHPVTSVAENSCQLRRCLNMESDTETSLKKLTALQDEHNIPSSGIISLTIKDPRVLPERNVGLVPEITSTNKLGDMREDGKNLSASGGIPIKTTESPSLSLIKPEQNAAFLGSMDLWDASKGIPPPVEENVICMEKHRQQLAFFCLDDKSAGKGNASAEGQFCSSCPIMLLNDSNKKGSIIRWSIILPLSWVKVFWVLLISGGAHAIGLGEKHWIACDVGLPYFPSDFPDSRAYSSFMAAKAADSDEKVGRRPPSMRPVSVPIPPPWESVRFAFEKESSTSKDSQTYSEEPYVINMVNENVLANMHCGKVDTTALIHRVFLSDAFVARTSNMLTHFLREIHGDHLFLFPHAPFMKNNITKFMKDNDMLLQFQNGTTTQISNGRRLCFLRVILHAYGGGVFEEGAAVCAPHYSDITLWTTRSDSDKENLEMPESSVRSYFEQQPCGKWELQMPKDPISRESYRWPIGFVTTGFVRGSKKPAAEALCEATLLARLREKQWNAMPVKQRRKDVYVLVRNLRSTACRLALATIVLELQGEDLEFM
ncbi:ribonucleases P/MRP protein subunit POP1 isoform X2 [Diospyros lotus]|uniref:ribonucleases P/MRP protein subunit POP1 isoform X2 n=1 Tax=Diospyros lotus TaxID=55363 RepID=UPI00225A227F|nr:ribonucleases P/MRP protein subunit POP1 isoform X2 [Diospyros lotus]